MRWHGIPWCTPESKVFKGTMNGRHVAIREIDVESVGISKDGLLLFQQSVAALLQLTHPNVAALLTASDDFGACTTPCLLYGYMQTTLFSELYPRLWGTKGTERGTKLPLDAAKKRQYTEEVAAGLSYLHSRQPAIAHCRLTPRNVMIDDDGRCKIVDVGMELLQQSSSSPTDVVSSTTATTDIAAAAAADHSWPPWLQAYTAPEVLCAGAYQWGKSDDDRALDVYAFGILAIEIASGQL